MKIAFVSGLSHEKLEKKLAPLLQLPEVERIDLFRNAPFHADKVHWIRVPAGLSGNALSAGLWKFVRLLINARQYDVIIGCHQKYHGVMAWLAGSLWRKPVVQIIISSVDWVYSRSLYRYAVMNSSACAVRGRICRQLLRDRNYRSSIEILANPFSPVHTQSTSAGKEEFDLLAVGNYAESKGYPWLLEVLAAVKEYFPEIRLAIAGSGPFRKKLGPQILRYQIDKNIRLLGWCNKAVLNEVYNKSRALVICSCREGLPMVALEAMSHSLPIFAASVGELPWLIRNGWHGALVPYGDTEAMTRAIVSVLSTPGRTAQMGGAAYSRVHELAPYFQMEPIYSAWRRLLQSVVEGVPDNEQDHRPGKPDWPQA